MNIKNTSIKQIAQDVITKYQTNDPFEIAKARGTHILYLDLGNTLGFTYYNRRNRFIIINKDISDEMTPYVCAHELGHTLLHKGLSLPYLKKHTLFSITKYEREADTFAVELLLPDHLIQEYEDCSLESIASFYHVPKEILHLKRQDIRK